ncbi:MAG TPA: hypothetical protein VMV33_08290, partial [Rhodocyclaceae bacterium]|nr:hypothetical protein [Rhodocyclaceae bacterium]
NAPHYGHHGELAHDLVVVRRLHEDIASRFVKNEFFTAAGLCAVRGRALSGPAYPHYAITQPRMKP